MITGWMSAATARLCISSLPPSLPISFLLPHTRGPFPFPCHAGMSWPPVLLEVSSAVGPRQPSCSYSPCTVAASCFKLACAVELPPPHTPPFGSGAAPLLCALSWVLLPSAAPQQTPWHQGIPSEEKRGGLVSLPSPGYFPGAWSCTMSSSGR